MRNRSLTTSQLGLLLIAYGLLGVVVIVGSVAALAPAADRVDEAISAVAGTTNSASRAARAAANALDRFGETMELAGESAADAADLSRSAATTSDSLADAMSISILGAQPLIDLADNFRVNSIQLEGLARELDEIGEALSTSDVDLALTKATLRNLAANLSRLGGRIGIRSGEPTGALPLLLVLFLTWVAIQVLASFVAGVALLRRPATPLRIW
jgi:hypothetical protein